MSDRRADPVDDLSAWNVTVRVIGDPVRCAIDNVYHGAAGDESRSLIRWVQQREGD